MCVLDSPAAPWKTLPVALRSPFPGISSVLALVGLLTSLFAVCLCQAGHSPGEAVDSMASMPCHEEPAGVRLTAPCCCEVTPEVPAVAVPFRASSLPERPAITAVLPNVAEAALLHGHREMHLRDRWIDRAPPPAFRSPLRI